MKNQVRQELLAKSAQIDAEYEEIQREKERLREEAAKAQRLLEAQHSDRVSALEKDFLTKLTQLEHSMSSDHSTTLATLAAQLQSQKE